MKSIINDKVKKTWVLSFVESNIKLDWKNEKDTMGRPLQ